MIDRKICAFILAAGLGTRLKPFTDSTPKCLMPVGGVPLLEHWLMNIEMSEVSKILINTHWLPEQIVRYVDNRESKVPIILSHEEELLGSAGTLLNNHFFVSDTDAILVIYGDNFTEFPVQSIIDVHFDNRSDLTIGTFHAQNPSACGIIEVDSFGRGFSFEEKPLHPKGNLAAGGIYVFSREFFNKISELKFDGQPFDLGRDVFPKLISGGILCPITAPLIDIGTPENYKKANEVAFLINSKRSAS